MNERIRELAEQADKLVSEENKYYGLMEYSEKFAELIIRECAKIADIADENQCEWIGGNILTRFGVEE